MHESGIAIEGEVVKYSCQINYAGQWAPTMAWRNNNGVLIPSSDSGTDGPSVVHEITLYIEPTDDRMSVSCETNFGPLNPAPGDKEATNIPFYYHQNQFDPITVHCKY